MKMNQLKQYIFAFLCFFIYKDHVLLSNSYHSSTKILYGKSISLLNNYLEKNYSDMYQNTFLMLLQHKEGKDLEYKTYSKDSYIRILRAKRRHSTLYNPNHIYTLSHKIPEKDIEIEVELHCIRIDPKIVDDIQIKKIIFKNQNEEPINMTADQAIEESKLFLQKLFLENDIYYDKDLTPNIVRTVTKNVIIGIGSGVFAIANVMLYIATLPFKIIFHPFEMVYNAMDESVEDYKRKKYDKFYRSQPKTD